MKKPRKLPGKKLPGKKTGKLQRLVLREKMREINEEPNCKRSSEFLGTVKLCQTKFEICQLRHTKKKELYNFLIIN